MYNLHTILPKCHFPFYLNCVGKMGNGKDLGNLFLSTEKLFGFSIWKCILILKYPTFLPVDFQLDCTIFSRLKIPSNLNYPVLSHFPLHILWFTMIKYSRNNWKKPSIKSKVSFDHSTETHQVIYLRMQYIPLKCVNMALGSIKQNTYDKYFLDFF